MIKKQNISKLGIGTWGVGGFLEKDPSTDFGKEADAIAYMISKGMNYIQVNMFYSEGYSVEIVAEAIKRSGKKRKDLLICNAMYLRPNKRLDIARYEIQKVCELLNTNYVDTFQVSHPSFKLDSYSEITNYIRELLELKRTKSVSITNSNLDLLKKFSKDFKNQIFAHECVLNFEVRANQDLGIIKYAEENNIQNAIFQPLRRNRTTKHNWPLLVELAKKYNKTQNQIILNWLTSKGYISLFKSTNIKHIDENLESLNFNLEKEDIKKIDEFRVPNYVPSKIYWDTKSSGVTIDQLSNVFDEEYAR